MPTLLALPRALLLVCLTLALPAVAGPKDSWIDAYGGWASDRGGQFFARVHHGKPPATATANESKFEKLVQTLETLELDAIPGAVVAIRGVPGLTKATADSHGFIQVNLPAHMKGPLHRLTMTLPASSKYKTSSASYLVPVWADKPGQVGVLSDIDDTLTDSDVTHKLRLGWNTLFHSQFDVKVFPGAGAAISSVTGTGGGGFPVRPLIYLSGSPWALHGRLSAAFNMHGLPKGAFLLRRFSKEPQDAFAFKHPHLQAVFAAFPQTTWVLFGDTGEKDPEVYTQMHVERPKQISRILIHNVTAADPKSPRFSAGGLGMTVFKDWSEASQDVAAHKLVFGHH